MQPYVFCVRNTTRDTFYMVDLFNAAAFWSKTEREGLEHYSLLTHSRLSRAELMFALTLCLAHKSHNICKLHLSSNWLTEKIEKHVTWDVSDAYGNTCANHVYFRVQQDQVLHHCAEWKADCLDQSPGKLSFHARTRITVDTLLPGEDLQLYIFPTK